VVRESQVEDYLHARVKELGGTFRRLKWIGRNHAPDDLILLPGRHLFIECKRPGETPRDGQLREAQRLRAAGFEVHVASTFQEIDAILPPPPKGKM
jgi:hypothetical protein